jgi:uncharacterized protein
MTTVVTQASPTRSRVRAGGALLLLLILSALFYYKWGGSLRTLDAVRATGKLPSSPSILLDGSLFATTLAYFKKIWPALVYGILVGAAVRAALPARWIRQWLGAGGARPTLRGALAGAPLMLCSCCVTPVFTGVHQRGAKLGPSIAVMLASPGLNVAALTLTFALLPARVGVVRALAALVIVLGLSALVGRAFGGDVRSASAASDAETDQNSEALSYAALARRFAWSVAYLTLVTIPLLVAGVVLSGLFLPHVTALSGTSTALAVAVAALVGTAVALPTFFEIPIGILLLSAGAPLAVVVAFVVAGPIVNLPSLFVLSRETHPKVAAALAGGVWVVATAAGLACL